MKPSITSLVRSPYGGMYVWKDPITGVEVMGTTAQMLYDNAIAERRANSAPIPIEFWEHISIDICKDYPQECSNVDPKQVRKRAWGMGDIVRGTLVMLNHKIHGSELVSQEEANRRARICQQCPQAVQFSKPCTGICKELRDLLLSTGGRTTPYDSVTRACGICGCLTAASVHFPLETQCVGVTAEMREQFQSVPNCWKSACS